MIDKPDIKIKKLFDDTKIPERAFETDSGIDLFAHSFMKIYNPGSSTPEKLDVSVASICLPIGARVLINTGISATVGVGYEIQIRPRSGLALKNGLTVLNTPGTIDESYRGPLCVIIMNHSGNSQDINKGIKIAQMVVCPVILSSIKIVSDFDETGRNAGGFGSTGV